MFRWLTSNPAHFPSDGSDDQSPPPPVYVENVKIRENSDKIRGPPGQGPVGTLYNPFKSPIEKYA